MEWLVGARTKKESKYAPFLLALALEFPLVTSLTTHGFVMGVRGKWLMSNCRIMEALGMSKKGAVRFAKTCSRTTILKSVDVFQAFNKKENEGRSFLWWIVASRVQTRGTHRVMIWSVLLGLKDLQLTV
ncbi:unnamed protein product [Boreogadus saida]